MLNKLLSSECFYCNVANVFSHVTDEWSSHVSFIVLFQVQIRPWNLGDSDFVMDGSQPLDPRKTIFVGGVPRPLRARKFLLNFIFLLDLFINYHYQYA